MYPTTKTMEKRLNIDKGKAQELRAIMQGTKDPEEYASVKAWADRCYYAPHEEELKMEAINAALGGYGVEAIIGRYVDRSHQDIQATYVNMGDTYTPTILHDSVTGNFVVTSWGDWVESHERSRELA